MGKNRVGLDFSEMASLAEKLDRVGGGVREAAQMSLEAARDTVTPKLAQAMKRHERSGDTEASLTDNPVKWDGLSASVDVGFDLKNGGMPSIFLMYGTPRMKKDSRLWNAAKGKKTKKEVEEIQRAIFEQLTTKAFKG